MFVAIIEEEGTLPVFPRPINQTFLGGGQQLYYFVYNGDLWPLG